MRGWRLVPLIVVMSVFTLVAGGCGDDGGPDEQASIFDAARDGSLCDWFTDAEVSAMTAGLVEIGPDGELFESEFGTWGCWWQNGATSVILAPLAESDAHPLPDELDTYPHDALSEGVRGVDWPEGDWPPRIDTHSDGQNLSVTLSVDGRSQPVWFSLDTGSDAALDVDTTLSIADEMLTEMGWVG